MNRKSTKESQVLVIVPGQLRNLEKHFEQWASLTKRLRVLVYTDDLSLQKTEASIFKEYTSLDRDAYFQRLMAPANRDSQRAKLFQVARLKYALEEIQNRLSSDRDFKPKIILKLRTDVGLKGLRLDKVLALEPGEILVQSDWAYAFHIENLDIMSNFYEECVNWTTTRDPIACEISDIRKIELGALKFNWTWYYSPPGLFSWVHAHYDWFTRFGRYGDRFHRLLLRLLSILKSREGTPTLISEGRRPLEANFMITETLFTWFVMRNFDKIRHLYHPFFGQLDRFRKQ